MRVLMTFEFNDDERARITRYVRERYGATGLPKLATRKVLTSWIDEAVANHWINVDDVESAIEERRRERAG